MGTELLRILFIGLFIGLWLIGFTSGVLGLISGVRGLPAYVSWRRTLAREGIAPFGIMAGMPYRFVPEMRLNRRLFGSRPESDAGAEQARLKARAQFVNAAKWMVTSASAAGLGLLVSLGFD